ncbi:MAG: hypothetical protein R2856_35600 [Caldilineaceae bacterium]
MKKAVKKKAGKPSAKQLVQMLAHGIDPVIIADVTGLTQDNSANSQVPTARGRSPVN